MPSADRPHSYLVPISVRSRISRPQPKNLDIINMGFNELPYGPSPSVAEAIAKACAKANSYGSPGCDALRQSIGAAYDLNPDQIICGNGSEDLLDVIARNFARPGDEILISKFGYIQFEMTAHRLGVDLKKASETDFATDVDAMIAAIGPRTKLIFLANPNNPTGTFVPVSELQRLADAIPDTVVLVLDLAYGEFTGFDYCAAVHRLVDAHENVVVTRTFSKAFGLAGLRAGWCHAPGWMLPGFYAARGMGSVNAVAQAAAVAAIADMDTVHKRVAEIVSERERVAARLSETGISALPSGTNFLLVTLDGRGPDEVEGLVEYLFDEAGIIVNRTREAGLEHFMRFSISLPAHNDTLLACAKSYMVSLAR